MDEQASRLGETLHAITWEYYCKELPAREGVMVMLKATLRWFEEPNIASENGGSTRRASVGFWLAGYSWFKWSYCCNPVFIEIFGEPRIICASISTSSTPICRHDPQEADTVRAEEAVP